jgi:thioesterase domain-containing protein
VLRLLPDCSMNHTAWQGLILLVLVAPLACRGAVQPAPKVASTSETTHAGEDERIRRGRSSLDKLVDVGGGLRLHIQCSGDGTPLVVFDSGLGQGSEAWHQVWGPVSSFTRACVYDRANHGSSDSAKVPHSNRQMARELYALLSNADEAAPYVLVGHSMGGTNVQLFLEEHSDSVAGMVLIDASPEPPPFDQIPPAAMVEFERNIARLEGLDVETMMAGFEELRTSKRTLGNKPLAILVAGRALEDPNLDATKAKQHLAERQKAQKPLLQLSSNGVLLVEENSAHHVPDEAPQTVIRTVEAVVTAVRTDTQLTASVILQQP